MAGWTGAVRSWRAVLRAARLLHLRARPEPSISTCRPTRLADDRSRLGRVRRRSTAAHRSSEPQRPLAEGDHRAARAGAALPRVASPSRRNGRRPAAQLSGCRRDDAAAPTRRLPAAADPTVPAGRRESRRHQRSAARPPTDAPPLPWRAAPGDAPRSHRCPRARRDDGRASGSRRDAVAMLDPQSAARLIGRWTPNGMRRPACRSAEEATVCLASFFGASPAARLPQPSSATSPPSPCSAAAQADFIETGSNSKPMVEVSASPARPVVMASLGSDNALPGVRQTALFEIKRKSGLDDDSDVDLHEDEDGGSVRLASAAGLARLAPNGLLKQTEAVDVACLKPSLVRVLKTIEQHYGRSIMVTSGYRSPLAQPPRARRQELAAHVLRRRRRAGPRRRQVGTGQLRPLHAGPWRRRHLLPHRIRCMSTSGRSATGTGAAGVANRRKIFASGGFARVAGPHRAYYKRLVFRAHRLAVRTPPFHGGNRGSIPLGRTKDFSCLGPPGPFP